jgi:NTE family protein
VEAFHFKKAGLVDSESFRLYFQAIFEDTDWRIPTQITATDMVGGRLKYLSQKQN